MISILLLGKFVVLRCWPTLLEIWQSSGLAEWKPPDCELTSLADPPRTALLPKIATLLVLLNSATNSFVFVVLKSAFESRRLRRARERQRVLVAQHADQVLMIGKKIAGERLFHPGDSKENGYSQI
ncbi:unnamed protein product [Toxocara canis]|nr:unnamed protein product [Toxocara canis]